jgi:hypothetical protein
MEIEMESFLPKRPKIQPKVAPVNYILYPSIMLSALSYDSTLL